MIVVTGASGRLGRLVAEALAERVSPTAVRLGTRDPGKIADLEAKGFGTVAADFDKPAGLATAFAGADALLIISGDAPNDVCIRQHRAAIDAAKAAGVGRVAYTSFTNPTRESLFAFAAKHADTEVYLKASGIRFTILRNNLYAENIPADAARAPGTLALPGARGKVAYIARADIAAAAAGVLTGDGHDGKTYEVTGPAALDLFEIAALLSAVWKRSVTAVDLPPAEFAKAFAARGMPPFVVEAITGLWQAVGKGEYAAVSADASRLAGRKLETLDGYFRRT